MDMIQAKCPGCGQLVVIAQDKRRASCDKCSTWVDARDAINVDKFETPPDVSEVPTVSRSLVSNTAPTADATKAAAALLATAPIAQEAMVSDQSPQATRVELIEDAEYPKTTEALVELIEDAANSDSNESLAVASERDRLFNEGTALLDQGSYPLAEKIFITMSLQYPDDYRGWWGRLRATSKDFKARDKKEITKEFMMKASSLAPEEMKFDIRKSYNDWLRDLASARVRNQNRTPKKSSQRNQNGSVDFEDYSVQPVKTARPLSKSCVIVPVVTFILLIAFGISISSQSPAPIIMLLIFAGAAVAFGKRD